MMQTILKKSVCLFAVYAADLFILLAVCCDQGICSPITNLVISKFGQIQFSDGSDSFLGSTHKSNGKAIASYKWHTRAPENSSSMRTFMSKSGHKVEARLLAYENMKVRLQMKGGKVKEIIITKFSPGDRAWIEKEQSRRRVTSGSRGRLQRSYVQLDFEVDLERMKDVKESFGLPTKWREVSYTDARDLENKISDLKENLRARGIKFDDIEKSPEVDYQWVIEKSRDDFKGIATKLLKEATKNGKISKRAYLAFVAAFVQSIEYELPPESYDSLEYGNVETSGFFMPLETLYRGKGDCDTKSALYASIVANIRDPHIVFLVGKNNHEHVFVGVRTVPRKGDRYITLKGVKYVLLELTAPLELGKIPESEWDAYNRGRLEPVKVVGD